MTFEEIKKQADRLLKNLSESKPESTNDIGLYAFAGAWTEATQFIYDFGGRESQFAKQIELTDPMTHNTTWVYEHTENAINALIRYLENGLHRSISPERQAQLDVVSDFLDQANSLLKNNKIHPAAPIVIIGAALEEFLRNWVEDENLIADTSRATIDTYAKLLKENEFLTKQDIKDITSWAGIRNDAAHGKWEEVNDKKRVKLMLEGVNHFMRKNSPDNY